MKGIVVGAGGTTRELLRRLSTTWEITVVEQDRASLELARKIRPFRAVLGDGSSRIVLERAGLDTADALVAATNNDDVNLEVCRIGKSAGLTRIVAISADPERIPDYRELQIPAFSPDQLLARRLEEGLESRRVSSQSFARGRAEAIEFEVAESSSVRGRALKDLRARSWVVGTILRDDELLIPHGDTRFQPGDLVTVVGAGADFAEILRTFTAGEARFPLDHGKNLAVALEEKGLERTVAETSHLIKHSRATSLLLIQKDPDVIRDIDEKARQDRLVDMVNANSDGVETLTRLVKTGPERTLEQVTLSESIGIIVRSAPGGGAAGLWRARRIVAMARKTRRPVLISRGSHPYNRILVTARRTRAGRTAARTAIDLAVQNKSELMALATVDPVFLAAADAPQEARLAISFVREEAAVLGQPVKSRIRRGNPVRIFLETAREESDLLVLGVDPERKNRFQMGVVEHLAHRAKVSVLLVPSRE